MLATVTVLIGALGLAGSNQKPACNTETLGQFWPSEANVNRDVARRLYQRGELEMCSLSVWKYKWERVSVSVHDLRRNAHAARETRKAADEEIR